jgi:hypothetical protein
MLWAPESSGSFSPPDQDSFIICIKCDDQRLCKDNLTTHVHKGGKTNEVVGEAGHDVPYSAGCK